MRWATIPSLKSDAAAQVFKFGSARRLLLTENPIQPPQSQWRRYLPWLNLSLTVGLIVAGLWYISTRISLASLFDVMASASAGYVALAVAVMVLTILLKSWRWQLMFPFERPPITVRAAFWATALGQYVNMVVPFLRLGEVARLYALNQEAGTSPGRALGTLVVEKTLDLIFFGLTIVFVLPFVILPDFVDRPGPLLVLLPLAILAVLYLLAYRTEAVIRIWRRVVHPLPQRLQTVLLRLAVNGLEGLAALRDRRLSLLMLLISLVIAGLSIYLPFVMFQAFDLNLGFVEAALMHIVVTIAIVPPSTPAKLGILNGAAALTLWQLGVGDETQITGYAILLYLVFIVPQILLGLIAASRTKWRWQSAISPGKPFVDIDQRRP